MYVVWLPARARHLTSGEAGQTGGEKWFPAYYKTKAEALVAAKPHAGKIEETKNRSFYSVTMDAEIAQYVSLYQLDYETDRMTKAGADVIGIRSWLSEHTFRATAYVPTNSNVVDETKPILLAEKHRGIGGDRLNKWLPFETPTINHISFFHNKESWVFFHVIRARQKGEAGYWSLITVAEDLAYFVGDRQAYQQDSVAMKLAEYE